MLLDDFGNLVATNTSAASITSLKEHSFPSDSYFFRANTPPKSSVFPLKGVKESFLCLAFLDLLLLGLLRRLDALEVAVTPGVALVTASGVALAILIVEGSARDCRGSYSSCVRRLFRLGL